MMKSYEVKETVTLTVQPGSVVILTPAQAEAVKRFVAPAKAKKKES